MGKFYYNDGGGVAEMSDLGFGVATPDALKVDAQEIAYVGADVSQPTEDDMIQSSANYVDWGVALMSVGHGWSDRITSLRCGLYCEDNYGTPTGGFDLPTTGGGGNIPLPPGEPGQVPTSQGPGKPPVWNYPVDIRTQVSDNDVQTGFLEEKIVAGSNVTLAILNEGGNEQLEISATGGSGTDNKDLKVSSDDTTPGFLEDKLDAGTGISLAVSNPAGDEGITITNASPDTKEGKVTSSDTTPNFLQSKIAAGDNITLGVLNPAGNEQLQVTAITAWPKPGKLKIGTTEYATFSAAVAAAISGDTILVGTGELQSDAVTVPNGVKIQGTGRNSSTLYTTTGADVVNVASGSTVTFQGITFDNRSTSGNPFAVQGGFSGTDGATITMINCALTNATSGGTQRGGFAATNGTHRLINCDITVSGGTSNYGVIAAHNSTGSSTITLEGGQVSGSTADFRTVTSNGLIVLLGAISNNGTFNRNSNLGRFRGHYYYGRKLWSANLDDARGSPSFHFNEGTTTFPTGWTEQVAATATRQTQLHSHWYLQGTSSNTQWTYRRQMGVTLESEPANWFTGYKFGPVLFRDGAYSADLDYYFGMHRDNSGTFDGNTFVRARLNWNSASSTWRVRSEYRDGVNPQVDGAWHTLSIPLIQPLYFRVLVRNVAAKNMRVYWGTNPESDTHSIILNVNPASAPTFGNFWLQVSRARGAGVDDYTYIDAIDFLENTP